MKYKVIPATLAFAIATTALGSGSTGGGGGTGGGTGGGSGGGSGSGGRAAEISSGRIDKAREDLRKRMKESKPVVEIGASDLAPARSAQPSAFDHRHSAFTQLLQKHVVSQKNGSVTHVDYRGFDRQGLKSYLMTLASVPTSQFESFTRDEQLAFLINVYNAYTIDLILQNHPVKSIKDIGSLFRSPWKVEFASLFGKKVHLDHIEHELIRGSGRYNEPRIHFAVNCASIGCPALMNEAFTADKLEQQLETSLVRFLSDRDRNRYDSQADKLRVSKIFDWYGGDFEKGHQGFSSLKQTLAKYADKLTDDPAGQTRIRNQQVDIEFLNYDWNLNETR